MITEDYCSPEVSKILKEKGLDKERFCHYVPVRNDDGTIEAVSVCTHQTAMKWLREIYGLHISVAPYLNNEGEVTWVWEIINIESATIIADSLDGDDFDSCEEAVEAALKYCLTNLI